MKTYAKLACGLIVVFALILGSCSKKKSTEPTKPPTSSLTFSTSPTADPSGLVVGEDAGVIIRVGITPNSKLIASSIRLLRVNSQNQVIDSLSLLYDDGDLAHGDEIIGDRIFSTKQNFHESSPGTIHLQIRAITLETGGNATAYTQIFTLPVVSEISDEEFNHTMTLQSGGSNKFDSLKNAVGESQAKQQTLDWVKAQSGVDSAGLTEGGDAIWVEYSSGIRGTILFIGAGVRGGSLERERAARVQVPPSQQTRGTLDLTRSRPAYTLVDEDTVGSTNVMIYDAFFTGFSPDDEGDALCTLLVKSQCPKFTVTRLKDAACTVELVKTFPQYGTIYLITHGNVDNGQVYFLSGEVTNLASLDAQRTIDLFLKRLGVSTVGGNNYYSIYPSFISTYCGTFPKSIVFSASCFSGRNQTMSDAFKNKGAVTFLGYDNSVNSGFCVSMATDFFQKMVNQQKKTGEAFTPGQIDPDAPYALFKMFGSNKARYGSEFVNGDFETGSLQGWTKEGDGRVLSQLVFISPSQGNFMGIISTGLGYTTTSGSISQGFCIPADKTTLAFKYNFLSEEFMKYVGDVYQDYLKVVLKTDSSEVSLFYRKIDDLAGEVTQAIGIHFDQPLWVLDDTTEDGVWMTGWTTVTLDVSAYAGKPVTLTFACGDVGDSIFDTAILLDDIKIQ